MNKQSRELLIKSKSIHLGIKLGIKALRIQNDLLKRTNEILVQQNAELTKQNLSLKQALMREDMED